MRKDKVRDMVRSILPSRYREAAGKAKRGVKRAVRRTVRQDLRAPETTKRDLLRAAKIDVQGRRDGDKLNHFMRWCHALTRGMAKDDALAFVRAFLPRNVIGDHAYFHWEIELRYPAWSRASWRERRRREIQSAFDRAVHVLRRAMDLDPDFAGDLNRLIKARTGPENPRRLLLGRHDVEAFVRTILFAGRSAEEIVRHSWPRVHCAEKKCVVELLAAIERDYAPKRGLALSSS